MRRARPPSLASAQQPPPIAAVLAPLQAAVRSQALIGSVAEALGEVVANALDAGASEVNIDVALAPDSLGFRVQDNGAGVPATSMPLLGQRFATSKARASGSPGSSTAGGTAPQLAPRPLGYRGEALAAIREAAAAVEVTSRAAGSFETLTITLQPGGRAAGPALAPEQRGRQGTVVAVRGLFAAQPVRRKALLSSGLQREADRCRDAVLRLALLRPGVTFTLFDRGRRAFVLRLLKGRLEAEGVAEFLGRPPHLVAALQPPPTAPFAVSGYAALPPHGQPGTSRQCIYVNGRWVKAPPVARLVDGVFQQCYKPNARLLEAQGEELQAVRKAANKHAAFVLHISCAPSEYELAHEAEGDLVQFRSWEPLLAAVQRSLLAAWRLVLSNALLKQLEQLEGGGAPGCAATGAGLEAAGGGHEDAAAAAGGQAPGQPGGASFQEWLQEQQEQRSFPTIQAQAAASAAAAAATAAAADNAPRHPSGGSGRQRGWAGGHKLSGAKHTLASRLVRYNGATALPISAQGSGGRADSSSGRGAARQPQNEQENSRPSVGAGLRLSSQHTQQQQQAQQQQRQQQRSQAPQQQQQSQPMAAFPQGGAPEAFSCQVLASRFPQHHVKRQQGEQALQPLQQQAPGGWHSWHQASAAAEMAAEQPAAACGPASWHGWLGRLDEEQMLVGGMQEQPGLALQELLEQQPGWPTQPEQQLPFDGEEEGDAQLGGWGRQSEPQVWQQHEAEQALAPEWAAEQRGWERQRQLGGSGASSSLRLRLGSSEAVEALIGSWGQPEAAARQGVPDAWVGSAAGDVPPGQPAWPACNLRGRLTAEERAMLRQVETAVPSCGSRRREHSAPPHHRPRQRLEPIRQPQHSSHLAEPAQGKAAGGAAMQPATEAAAEWKPAGSGKAAQQPQGHCRQDTGIQHAGPGGQVTGGSRGGNLAASSGRAIASRSGTALEQQQAPAAPPAAQQAVPDFLGPNAGLDELMASWRRPAAAGAPGQAAAAGGGSSAPSGILSLETLSDAAFARLSPASLSREKLAAGRALQQVDRKFVPIVCGSLLALVDQHAADERVQLERLRDLLLGPEGQPRTVGSQALRAPLPLDLTDVEQQLLETYQHKVQAWGWRWLPAAAGGRGGLGRPAVPTLTHVPLLWAVPMLSAADLKLYLHHLHDTCGAGGLPAGVVRVLNSKACRSAIMFGDALEQGQCQGLLDQLAATQLCFSCAHGRPTTVPLVDLRLLQRALRLRAEARAAAAGGTMGSGAAAAGGTEGGTAAAPGLAGLKARLQGLL